MPGTEGVTLDQSTFQPLAAGAGGVTFDESTFKPLSVGAPSPKSVGAPATAAPTSPAPQTKLNRYMAPGGQGVQEYAAGSAEEQDYLKRAPGAKLIPEPRNPSSHAPLTTSRNVPRETFSEYGQTLPVMGAETPDERKSRLALEAPYQRRMAEQMGAGFASVVAPELLPEEMGAGWAGAGGAVARAGLRSAAFGAGAGFGSMGGDLLSGNRPSPGRAALTAGGYAAGAAPFEVFGEAYPPIRSALREWAMDHPDVAALRAMHVNPTSTGAQSALRSVEGVRPFARGVRSEAELQKILPGIKDEAYAPIKSAIDSHGDRLIAGPDGPITLRDLEAERQRLSALNLKIKAQDPAAIQQIIQKGQTAADLLAQEKAVKAALIPALSDLGVDAQASLKAFGQAADVQSMVAGRRGDLARAPMGFGRMAKGTRVGVGVGEGGDLYAGGGASAKTRDVIQGGKDILAGRGWWSGSPSDIAVREGFRIGGEKPNFFTQGRSTVGLLGEGQPRLNPAPDASGAIHGWQPSVDMANPANSKALARIPGTSPTTILPPSEWTRTGGHIAVPPGGFDMRVPPERQLAMGDPRAPQGPYPWEPRAFGGGSETRPFDERFPLQQRPSPLWQPGQESALPMGERVAKGELVKRFDKETLAHADQELQAAFSMADELESANPHGMQFSPNTQADFNEGYVPVRSKAAERGPGGMGGAAGQWQWNGSTRASMKAMFPWYDGEAVDLATLRKAAQNPGGADYQRVVGRIAESLMKEKPPTREPGED